MKWFTRSLVVKLCFLALVACSNIPNRNLLEMYDPTEIPIQRQYSITVSPIDTVGSDYQALARTDIVRYLVVTGFDHQTGQKVLIVAPEEAYSHLSLEYYNLNQPQKFLVYQTSVAKGATIFPIEYDARETMGYLCVSTAKVVEAIPLCY